MQPPADGSVDPDGPATDAASTPTDGSAADSIDGWTPPLWTAGPDAPAGWTPPPWSPDAADTRPSWRPALVMIGYVVLIVLIGIGIGLWATVDDYSSVRDLAVGECFDYRNTEGEVLRHSCTVLHDGEIIGDVTLPEGPYPGDDGIDEVADRACTHDFTNYVGKSPDDSELDLYYWTPTESLWNDGDRLVVCEAYNGVAITRLTGSIKNSHR